MDTSSNLTPITALAMDELHRRPASIARQASEMLSSLENKKPRILVWGVAYKPNVSDVRESPALGIISELLEQDIETEFHDPYVAEVSLNSLIVKNVPQPNFNEYDLVILHTIHGAGVPEGIFESAQRILDTTFKFAHRDGVVTPS
jgi:UDP-N-acetyl-D-mannosaminuronate dehydrogenase